MHRIQNAAGQKMHRNAHTARTKNAAVENANKGGLECIKMQQIPECSIHRMHWNDNAQECICWVINYTPIWVINYTPPLEGGVLYDTYPDVSCIYPEGCTYPSCILMYLKCISHALLHSKRIHVSWYFAYVLHVSQTSPRYIWDTRIHIKYINFVTLYDIQHPACTPYGHEPRSKVALMVAL